MEIGSLAEWVGGLGSIAAVIAAWLIGRREARDAKAERDDAKAQQLIHRGLLIKEASRLLGEAHDEIGHLPDQFDAIRKANEIGALRANGLLNNAERFAISERLGRKMRRLNELKQICDYDPAVFSAIGRAADTMLFADRIFEEDETLLEGDLRRTISSIASAGINLRTLSPGKSVLATGKLAS